MLIVLDGIREGGTAPPRLSLCPPTPSFGAVLGEALGVPQGLDRGPRILQAAGLARPVSRTGLPALLPLRPATLESPPERGSAPLRGDLAASRARPAERLPFARLLSTGNPDALVSRLADLTREARTQDASTLRLILDPAELGHLRIELRVRGGLLHGAIRTERPAAAQLLRERLGELLDRLSSRGLRAGAWTIDAEAPEPPGAAPPSRSCFDVRV